MIRYVRAASVVFAFAVAYVGVSNRAGAQDGAEPTVGMGSRERAQRAAQLFDEGKLDAALAEYRRAYAQTPNFRVLYNIARVYDELGDAVQAVEHYRRFLVEGSEHVSPARRQDIESRIAEQQRRIAELWITTSVEGALLSVDGTVVRDARGAPLRTPLTAPIRLSAGRHTVLAHTAHHRSLERDIELAGGVDTRIELALHPIASNESDLMVRANVVDVIIRVDGKKVGATPLKETVPLTPGSHRIEGSRAGYITEVRTVTAKSGARQQITLVLKPDRDADPGAIGTLNIELPKASHAMLIDGRPVRASILRIPRGRHKLEIDMVDREPLRTYVNVPGDETFTYRPALTWTPQAREDRIRSARKRRLWGKVAVVTGSVFTVGMGALFVRSQLRLGDLRGEQDRLGELQQGCRDPNFSPDCRNDAGALEDHQRVADEQVAPEISDWRVAAAVGGAGASVGVGLLISGAVLLAKTPSDAAIDADARSLATSRNWKRKASRWSLSMGNRHAGIRYSLVSDARILGGGGE